MSESHAERNAAQLRRLERELSRELIDQHNALVSILGIADEDVHAALLNDAQAATLEDAFDQIEAVADSLRQDDRIHDDRLLASTPGGGD